VKKKETKSDRSSGSLLIAGLRDSDLDRIMAIEKASFSLPWTQGMFLDSMRNREVGCHYGVWIDGDLQAYVIAWKVLDELHIGNLAVIPALRRQRIAERLLAFVLERFWADGGQIATLEVRMSNHQARNLYGKLGFRDVAIRRGYYHDNREDAVVMLADRP
jgi:ribosomal-protein-alanine N-acetyltransferase